MPDLLDTRNAFVDHAGVPSRLVFTMGLPAAVKTHATIAIPTYRRPRVLAEAIRSAFDQTWSGPVEIVVVDNEADEDVIEDLRQTLNPPENVRLSYYANAGNLGMFGNWNRSIELSSSEWITILNDDDLLAPRFLQRMDDAFDLATASAGLLCQKTAFDVRIGQTPAVAARKRWLRDALLDLMRFRGADRRTLEAKTFFWDCVTGNGLGFLFRRTKAIELGGYQPEDYPSADYFFFARYAARFGLVQVASRLAFVRIEDNATLRTETLEATIRQNHKLRGLLLNGWAPQSWSRWSSWIVAWQFRTMDRVASAPLDRQRIASGLDLEPARGPSAMVLLVRLAHSGL